MPRTRRVLTAVAVVLLCLLASSGPAMAAPPSGAQTWSLDASVSIRVDCAGTDCTGALAVALVAPFCGTVPWVWFRSDVDPLTRMDPAGKIAQGSEPGSPSRADSVCVGTGGREWPSQDPGPGRYVYAAALGAEPGSTQVLGVWDLGAPSTSTPSPTSSPPAPTTSAPPTSTSTPSEPTSTTTTPPPTGGSGGTGTTTLSCPQEAPCYVRVVDGVTVDATGLTVEALTEEQWSNLVVALSALVFFTGAHFVASWRHGRSGS